MHYSALGYTSTGITLVFEMWNNGAPKSGETVTGNWLAVGSGSMANITTLNNTISEVGSSGTYTLALDGTELGANPGFAKLVLAGSGCDESTVITIQVIDEIPANTTTLSDKTDIILSMSSWYDFLGINMDAGLTIGTYFAMDAAYRLGPNDTVNSISPKVLGWDGETVRYYFTYVDGDGNRTTRAVLNTEGLWADES